MSSSTPPKPSKASKDVKAPRAGSKAKMTRLLKDALDESSREMRIEVEAERLPSDLLTLHFKSR